MKNGMFLSIISLALMLGLSSCSSDPTAVAKKMIEDEINASGYFKMLNFEKKDGVTKKMDGIDVYKLEFIVELEFLHCITCSSGWGNRHCCRPYENEDIYTYPIRLLPDEDCYIGSKPFIVGQKVKAKGSITLAKHENGWVKE